MKKKLIATAAIVLAVGGGALAAAPANAATFTGYSSTNYSGLLVSSSTTANTTVDVADNQLSSGKNAQGRRWCAVNEEGGVSKIRFIFAPNSNASTLGQYNKTADFLWAGTAGGCS